MCSDLHRRPSMVSRSLALKGPETGWLCPVSPSGGSPTNYGITRPSSSLRASVGGGRVLGLASPTKYGIPVACPKGAGDRVVVPCFPERGGRQPITVYTPTELFATSSGGGGRVQLQGSTTEYGNPVELRMQAQSGWSCAVVGQHDQLFYVWRP